MGVIVRLAKPNPAKPSLERAVAVTNELIPLFGQV